MVTNTLKVLADSRFIIRFKIIHCNILKACLTILGYFLKNFHEIGCYFFPITTFNLRQLAYIYINVQLLLNYQTIVCYAREHVSTPST